MGFIWARREDRMIYIGAYEELNPGKNFPSMKESFSEKPYNGQEEIIHYLLHGKEDIASFKIPKDVFTGNVIPMSMIGMNDGEYTWWNTLAYYVKNYNLRLPTEFERKILRA